MPPAPDRELLSQSAARELLERAGQIDSDSTTVETLRVAAREAGISEAAFETALVEMRGKLAAPAKVEVPRSRRRLVFGIIAAGVLLAAALPLWIMPRALIETPAESYVDHEIVVQCLPMNVAQDLARTLLVEGNEIQVSQGSRILRIRATAAQRNLVANALETAARGRTTCDNTPAGR